jgi:hypothetical protein
VSTKTIALSSKTLLALFYKSPLPLSKEGPFCASAGLGSVGFSIFPDKISSHTLSHDYCSSLDEIFFGVVSGERLSSGMTW